MKGTLSALAVLALAASALAREGGIEVAAGGRSIPGRYIVVLEEGLSVPEVAQDMAARYGGRVLHLYDAALEGFAVQMAEDDAEGLAADPRVSFVEQDSEAWPMATQTDPTWGIDRVDQHALPLSGSYTYFTTAGNVHVYVIDTGIRAGHTQFGGRVGVGASFINDGFGAGDCHGHGTHVAGTIGGITYGVAKSVRLHSVRVLGCSGPGTVAGIIAGVDWVTSHSARPAVATMGLATGGSSALDAAVGNSISSGVTYVVAAGSSNADACRASPARVGPAITVGATTTNDARSSFSNFGRCLDIFAPGSGITSAWATSDTAVNTIGGTSMAAAHVAGVAALYLATHTNASPGTVSNALVNGATPNVVGNAGPGSPNRLLFSLIP